MRALSSGERLSLLATRQEGALRIRQIREAGLDKHAVGRWVRAGHLHREYPGVYSLGHRALSHVGQLIAALFYAGDGSALTAGIGLFWWGLLGTAPETMQIATPNRRARADGLILHRRARVERVLRAPPSTDSGQRREPGRTPQHRLPVTPVPRALLDYAAGAMELDVRKALAQADYRCLLDMRAVRAVTGRGLRGSTRLNEALDRHLPQLARTKSPLEDAFLLLCEREGLPLPQINMWVAGQMVDAYWPEHGLVVELDSWSSHSSAARRLTDHARDLKLRANGLVVRRYTRHQVEHEPTAVATDLRCALATRRNAAA